jgi:hypothetical protein
MSFISDTTGTDVDSNCVQRLDRTENGTSWWDSTYNKVEVNLYVQCIGRNGRSMPMKIFTQVEDFFVAKHHKQRW